MALHRRSEVFGIAFARILIAALGRLAMCRPAPGRNALAKMPSIDGIFNPGYHARVIL